MSDPFGTHGKGTLVEYHRLEHHSPSDTKKVLMFGFDGADYNIADVNSSGALAVTAVDLDIRDLDGSQDDVRVEGLYAQGDNVITSSMRPVLAGGRVFGAGHELRPPTLVDIFLDGSAYAPFNIATDVSGFPIKIVDSLADAQPLGDNALVTAAKIMVANGTTDHDMARSVESGEGLTTGLLAQGIYGNDLDGSGWDPVDVEDTNYTDGANRTGLNTSPNLIQGAFTSLFDNEAIDDTANHDSAAYDMDRYSFIEIFLDIEYVDASSNGRIQIFHQWSNDGGTKWHNMGHGWPAHHIYEDTGTTNTLLECFVLPRLGSKYRMRVVGTNTSGTKEFQVTADVRGRNEP